MFIQVLRKEIGNGELSERRICGRTLENVFIEFRVDFSLFHKTKYIMSITADHPLFESQRAKVNSLRTLDNIGDGTGGEATYPP